MKEGLGERDRCSGTLLTETDNTGLGASQGQAGYIIYQDLDVFLCSYVGEPLHI